MRSVIIVLLGLVILGVAVRAGVLDLDTGSTSASGTLFTATWSLGCPASSLGPNQCYSAQPWFCPVDSRGTSSDELEEGCDPCGCPYGSGTYCDEDNPGPCRACQVECDDVCEPGWTSCTFDYAAECAVINVDCEYPAPEWIGLVVQRRGDVGCGDRRGNHLYGTSNGDGTYDDCYAAVTEHACPSGDRVQINTVGTLLSICPGGYIQSEWGTPAPNQDDDDVYRPLSCTGDNLCDDPDPDPDPGPDPVLLDCDDGVCSNQLYYEWSCQSGNVNRQVVSTKCRQFSTGSCVEGGYILDDPDYTNNKDCDDEICGSGAVTYSSFCTESSARCVC